MTIHTELKQAGIEIYHGECSLVVKDCPTARAILANYGVNSRFLYFIDPGGSPLGDAWLELPEEL